jgi:hypothetical protein
MIQTMRFTFAADPKLYPPSPLIQREDKVYFAVLVIDVDENAVREVISSTIVGILPAQESRYRYQGYHRLNPGELPLLRDVIIKHFERDEERMRTVVNRQQPWPQFHNGAGLRTPDDELPSPLRPFLIQ